MISVNVKYFCNKDISLVENYDKAIADKEHTWHCHHRYETDYFIKEDLLKAMDLYLYCDPSELIFLKSDEHLRLHAKEKITDYRTKQKKRRRFNLNNNIVLNHKSNRPNNRVWVNYDNKSYRVNYNELEHYLNMGYKEGRYAKPKQ